MQSKIHGGWLESYALLSGERGGGEDWSGIGAAVAFPTRGREQVCLSSGEKEG